MAERERKLKWRVWLRAVHRDVGYLAIGFTVIYAISGIAQNHIEDWGDVSYRSTERVVAMAEFAADVPDAVAIARTADAAGLGAPVSSLRAGDEVRLEYADGSKVTAIGTRVTVQSRERRAVIGVANWLHTVRGKPAWKYIADAYAVLLLYLAVSGMFMIKGRLGLAWRGTAFISAGFAVPVLYVALSGSPSTQKPPPDVSPQRTRSSLPGSPAAPQAGGAILTPLAPDDN